MNHLLQSSACFVLTIKIVDLTGSIVMGTNLKAGVQTLNTESLAKGVYFINIEDAKQTLTKKMIKK